MCPTYSLGDNALSRVFRVTNHPFRATESVKPGAADTVAGAALWPPRDVPGAHGAGLHARLATGKAQPVLATEEAIQATLVRLVAAAQLVILAANAHEGRGAANVLAPLVDAGGAAAVLSMSIFDACVTTRTAPTSGRQQACAALG